MNKIVLICGPTATGKTKLAVKLARLFNGEIISADSRQVYKGMDIGTGKDLHEYGKVKYHLIDIVKPQTQFTVAHFQKYATRALNDIWRRGKLPIIVGGTGLYIDALLKGYQLPSQSDNKIRRRLDNYTLKQLLALLKKIDYSTYKIIDKKNRRRVQRALEIYYATGKTKFELAKKFTPKYQVIKLGLFLSKPELNKKIEQRLKLRIKQGMIQEVKRLHDQGVSWKRFDQIGLEYRQTAKLLKGEYGEDEYFKILNHEIQLFAKRQMTWLKRDNEIYWIKSFSEAKKLVKDFL